MSRCYPFPPPGYEKKNAPPLSADVAQPTKKERHKHKDKKKKKKKDADTNGDAHDKDSSRPSKQLRTADTDKDSSRPSKQPRTADTDKDSSRPSKQPRTADTDKDSSRPSKQPRTVETDKDSSRPSKQPRTVDADKDSSRPSKQPRTVDADKDSSRPSKQPRTVLINDLLQPKEEKTNGKVRDVNSTAAVERPLGIKEEVRDGGISSAQVVSEGNPTNPPQSLYIKQETNGKASAKPALVLPPESSGSVPSSRAAGSNFMQPTLPSNNLASQRQSKASELPTTSACEMMALRQPDSWSDVADEDWLFAERPLGSHPKPKAEVDRGAEEATVQVWAEAVFLPSVDIYALPYVVPY